MPPVERDAPVDRPPHLRHQSSTSSDQGRALIPMWDSSDPERAPPPLPLHPKSPTVGIGTSRVGTSAAIASAHAALNEKARENALVPAMAKRMTLNDPSPERALVPRGNPHKRMQSMQTPTVRDLSLMIEGSSRRDSVGALTSRSPDKSNRPQTPNRGREPERREPERPEPAEQPQQHHQQHQQQQQQQQHQQHEKEDPPAGTISVAPALRPLLRRPPQQSSSILGENIPPQSATMLALHNMHQPRDMSPSKETPAAEPPLATTTNNSSAPVRMSPPMDKLSAQITTLTNIATALQKEMSTLSRRSRDNATDLMSLKEATHARDEDIRRSLRDLAINVDPNRHSRDSHRHKRDAYNAGADTESNANGSPKGSKGFCLPRIPSPHSFSASIDRESILSAGSSLSSAPSLVSESPATMALLEKILREMGTKDGQDAMLANLTELAEKLSGMASAGKIEELIHQLRSTSQELALVPASGGPGGGGGGMPRTGSFGFDDEDGSMHDLDWNPQPNRVSQRVNALLHASERQARSPSSTRSGDVLSDDLVKAIRAVKDSVAQGGGLTAEVKALVRELRGEVLGMGREIGRRLDEVHGDASDSTGTATKTQTEKVVDESIEQMKLHMTELLNEHRRASTEALRSAVDYQEIYNAMSQALSQSETGKPGGSDVLREDVVEAVKDAWENYKPDISVEQIGLDRDEILACLKEGLQTHAPQHDGHQGTTRDEVYEAVVEGLKNFNPPKLDTPASLTREDILDAVRQCLEEFEIPVGPAANELTREDMLEAVKEGLQSFDFPTSSKAMVPLGGDVDHVEVTERLHDLMQFMRDEFKAVADEAKKNAAANDKDTEQVLDATKGGFEQLRSHMQEYVGLANGTSGQEEHMEKLVRSLNGFRDEVAGLVAKSTEGSKAIITEEIGSLRDAVNSALVPHTPPAADNSQILEAMREGLERVRQELLRPHAGTSEILDAMHEGFGDLRNSVEKMTNKPADLTANDEILDALKSGLESVRKDIDALREQQLQDDKALATIGRDDNKEVALLDHPKEDDFKNLEGLLVQLRGKLETLEPPPASDSLSKQDLAGVEEMLRNIQVSVAGIANMPRSAPDKSTPDDSVAESSAPQDSSPENLPKQDFSNMKGLLLKMQETLNEISTGKKADGTPRNIEDASTKEDVIAIETILRNTKDRLDDMIDGEQAVRKDHVDAIEALLLETKESLESMTERLESTSKKEDVSAVEALVTKVTSQLDEMKESAEKALGDPERVTKTHIDAIEAVCLEVKLAVEETVKSDIAALPSKEDLQSLEGMIKSAKSALESQVEANAKAFEERQAETAGVAERVSEVKTFLEEFQTMVQGKLDNENMGLEALQKLLDGVGETLRSSTVSTDLKEMFELMKTEFEESKSSLVGAKLDADEKLQAASDSLGSKFELKIGELITKYEAFQLLVEGRAKAGEARDAELEKMVVGSKAVADELKLLVDTLGSTVTESMEKTEEASKTVFERVEELVAKTAENHADDKNEHSLTRDQVKAAVTIVEGLQGHVVEHQPKILEIMKNVALVVAEHYEHSKTTTTTLQKQIEDVKEQEPKQLPPPVEKYDDTKLHAKLDKLLDGTDLHAKLDKMLDDAQTQAKLDKILDGAGLHTKLDRLVDHSHTADKAYTQLETLDKVHAQVIQTASDISSFLEEQKKRIEHDRQEHLKSLQEAENKLQETNISLAVAQAEKEYVEAHVVSLRSEEDGLRESIMALRTEQEYLLRQKTRLTADVSSLETAMDIRREELHTMEARAEGLERRILEGVLDHSRALLLTKGGAKGREAMSRKRVPGARSSLAPADASALNAQSPAPHRKAVNMAVNGSRVPPSPSSAARRILSLSQIGSNLSSGGMKRSQSVRNPAANGTFRNGSWGGGAGKKRYGDLEADKENEVIDSVREIDEPSENDTDMMAETPDEPEEAVDDDDDDDDDASSDITATGEGSNANGGGDEESEDGPSRRSSQGTTVITSAESEAEYTDGEDDEGSNYADNARGTAKSAVDEDGAVVVYAT